MRYLSGLLLLLWMMVPPTMAAEKPPVVELHTNYGTLTLQLNHEKAPLTVANFLNYAREGFYTGTLFHRVIPDYMIQGGAYTTDYAKKPVGDPIASEADNGLKNQRGTVAMSRGRDPHSATSQFFINTVDNDMLDFSEKTPRGWGYTVFGKVVAGMDTVDDIQYVETGPVGPFSKQSPLDQVIIEKVVIKRDLPPEQRRVEPSPPPAGQAADPSMPEEEDESAMPEEDLGEEALQDDDLDWEEGGPEAGEETGMEMDMEEDLAEPMGLDEEAVEREQSEFQAGEHSAPEADAEPKTEKPAGSRVRIPPAYEPELPDVPAVE